MKQFLDSFRNYGTWVAVLAFVAFLLMQYVPGFDIGAWDKGVELFLGVLVALGIISNPTKGKWFKDTESQEDETESFLDNEDNR